MHNDCRCKRDNRTCFSRYRIGPDSRLRWVTVAELAATVHTSNGYVPVFILSSVIFLIIVCPFENTNWLGTGQVGAAQKRQRRLVVILCCYLVYREKWSLWKSENSVKIQLLFVEIHLLCVKIQSNSVVQLLVDEYLQAQPHQNQSQPTLPSAWSIVVNAPKQVPQWPSYLALFSCKNEIFYFRVPDIWYGDKHNIKSTHQ